MKVRYIIFLSLFLFIACKDPVHPTSSPSTKVDMNQEKIDDAFKTNKGRDVWQRPGKVLDMLGDIKGKTVADIGAGTGFFSFRLLFRDAKVIAVDIDPMMLEIMNDFKTNLDEQHRELFSTRLALPQDSKIEPNEADIFLVINTIGFIENRSGYLSHLFELLPSGGKIMIVDFKRKSLPIEASPIEYRVPLFELENDLKTAGFSISESNDKILDYQYVLIGEKK